MLWMVLLLFLCACGQSGTERAVYRITVEGSPEKPGVIEFAELSMNVYRDVASNPCGDCEEQPVSVYVGTEAGGVAGAMANAVEEADDLWEVTDVSGNVLLLTEKIPGSVPQEPLLRAPEGLALRGTFYPAGAVLQEQDMADPPAGGSGTADGDRWRTLQNLDGSPMNVTHDPPERIAAVYGPAYEALVVLGAEDRIVMCSDVQFENFPWARKIFGRIDQLPYLKNVHSSVNTEELKRQNPQLALTFYRPNELRKLNALDIAAVYGVTSRSLQDIPEQLKIYADAVGQDAPERAERYEAYFHEKLNRIRSVTENIPEEQRPLVYYAGIDILTTYGNRSDLCEVIEAAGGRSVTADLNAGNHAQISFEQLADWNPEYIFIDHGAMNERDTAEEILSDVSRNHRYQAIRAVQNGEIHLTPSGVFYWDMGLQKILLVMNMAKTLHPGEFADLDMTQELIAFYREFYGYELSEEEAVRILNREDPPQENTD